MDTLAPRTLHNSRGERFKMSRSPRVMLPAMRPGGSGIRRKIDKAVTDLPLPDSPTSPTVLPASIDSERPSTARTVPELFARNERVICDFDTDQGPMCLVLVGALFVGSIETVFAGEINPPSGRKAQPRVIEAGVGARFARGAEIGRFNMGSTVIVLFGKPVDFFPGIEPGQPVRLGRPLARFAG